MSSINYKSRIPMFNDDRNSNSYNHFCPTNIPSTAKRSSNQMIHFGPGNLPSTSKRPSNSNFFGPSNIPSTAKSMTRTNSLGFNSVKKPSWSKNSDGTTIKMNQMNIFQNCQIPSTAKTINRAVKNVSGFNSVSVQKNATKLFGMTPQTNRTSYMSNGTLSTTRLSSRQSIKDNRMLSDGAWQRDCQEKIVDFLTINGYPNQVTRQNLIRLSLSDASRIFQFLFSFFNEDVVIKNGPDTSLDVVVPKMMTIIGYPFQIKKSDLISFTGGRQLGTVLSMMDYIIDYINCYLNSDVQRLISREAIGWSEEDNDDISKVLPRLHDLTGQNWEHENWDNDRKDFFIKLSEELYGTEEEVEQFKVDVESLERTLANLDNELAYWTELPNKKQELVNNISNAKQYTEEMIQHNEANLIMKNALIEEIRKNKESVEILLNENKRLEGEVNAQKDVIIEYQYAIERRKQIEEEINQVEMQNRNFKEAISTLNLEINKEKSQLQLLINDFDEMINIIMDLYKNSKIHKFLDLNLTFESDMEWRKFFEKFDKLKSSSLDTIMENEFSELKYLSLKKFKNFKEHLLEPATKLKTTILVDIACKHTERQGQRDCLKKEVSDVELQLETLWTKKNDIEKQHQTDLKTMDDQVEELKQKLMEHKQFLDDDETSLKKMKNEIQDKENQIIIQKYKIMKNFNDMVQRHMQIEDDYIKFFDEKHQKLDQHNQLLKKIVTKLITD